MESKKSKDQAMLRENVEHEMPEGSWQEIRLDVERRVRWWLDDYVMLSYLIIMMR